MTCFYKAASHEYSILARSIEFLDMIRYDLFGIKLYTRKDIILD